MARRSDQRTRGARLREGRPAIGQPEDVAIPLEPFCVQGLLWRPVAAGGGLVIVANGTHAALASSFTHVAAAALLDAGVGVLALDLMTREEGEQADDRSPCSGDLWMIAGRLAIAIDWARAQGLVPAGGLGIVAASGAGAPAAIAASERPSDVAALALCCRRPDRAGPALAGVRAPTLLLVPAARDLAAHQRAAAIARDAQLLEAGADASALAEIAARWAAERLGTPLTPPATAEEAAPPPA
jgi:putative phosphoribosyl transferase